MSSSKGKKKLVIQKRIDKLDDNAKKKHNEIKKLMNGKTYKINKKKITWNNCIGPVSIRPNINERIVLENSYYRLLLKSELTAKQIFWEFIIQNNKIHRIPKSNDIITLSPPKSPDDDHTKRKNLIEKAMKKKFYLGLDCEYKWMLEICIKRKLIFQ